MKVSEKLEALDGREVAIIQQTAIMRQLHRFGWLRTRDLACLSAGPVSKSPPKAGPSLQPPVASRVDIRRVQRHLAKLREMRLVLKTQAPNGSLIYALSERGARTLQGLGLAASTGKDMLRRYHAAYFLHRNVANMVAISAVLQGFSVSTEREIAQGKWLGGSKGIFGKRPDVVIRSGEDAWMVEVERSHRNFKDYAQLRTYLSEVWRGCRLGQRADLGSEHRLRQVIFVSTQGFARKLTQDLLTLGWSAEEIAVRIRFECSLYSFKDIAFF
jgi:hypothetical protein